MVSIIASSGAITTAQAVGVPAGATQYAHECIRVDRDATIDGANSLEQLFIDHPQWNGTGTEDDPYIIENLTIDATGKKAGIYIGNTTAFLIIRNCTVNYASAVPSNGQGGAINLYRSHNVTVESNYCYSNACGILLYQSTDNHIIDNNCSSNTYDIYVQQSANNLVDGNSCYSGSFGIVVENSNYCIVTANTCISNTYGIRIYLSNYCTVNENTCRSNNYGIYVTGSNHDNVSSNFCYLSSQYGIEVENSNNITLMTNKCTFCVTGIYLTGSIYNDLVRNNCSSNFYGIYPFTGSNYNDIVENNCSYNSVCGVYLSTAKNNYLADNELRGNRNGVYAITSNNNNMTRNLIAQNSGPGIHMLTPSRGNTIYDNQFINNNGSGVQALDTGMNYWNVIGHGNFWSDRTAPDYDGDGIVDQEYVINRGKNADYYPLTGVIASVSITSPVGGTTVIMPTVNVTGTADPQCKLVVNGIVVFVEDDGSFSVVIYLYDGVNTIQARSFNSVSEAADSVVITYTSERMDFQDLEDNATEQQALIESLRTQLATAQAAITATNVWLASVSDTLDACYDAHNATASEVASMLVQVQTMKASLVSLRASLNDTNGALASTNANVTALASDLDDTLAQLTALETELTTVQGELQAEIDDVNDRVTEIYSKLNTTIDDLADAIAHLDAIDANLTETNDRLDLTNEQLAAAIAFLVQVSDLSKDTELNVTELKQVLSLTRLWLQNVNDDLVECYDAQNATADDVASLLGQVASVRASLTTLRGSLNVTDANTTALVSGLDAVISELDSAEASLTTVQSTLTANGRAPTSDSLPLIVGALGLLMGLAALILVIVQMARKKSGAA